jgi:hypothetical protein
MILYDIFLRNKDKVEQITNICKNCYPENESFDYVEYVFRKCLLKTPKETFPIKEITIKKEPSKDNDGKFSYDVSGYCNEDGDYYALEFNDWAEWMAYPVSCITMENFLDEEIIAHCIEEMTFLGLEEDIEEAQKRLEQIKDDLDSGNYTGIPFEELEKLVDNQGDDNGQF